MKRLSVALSALLVVIAMFLLVGLHDLGIKVSRPHWWIVSTSVRIYSGGNASDGSKAYRSSAGELLVVLDHPGGHEMYYLVRVRQREVDVVYSRVVHSGLVAYVEDAAPRYVMVGGSKMDFAPRITSTPGRFEFTGLNDERVSLRW